MASPLGEWVRHAAWGAVGTAGGLAGLAAGLYALVVAGLYSMQESLIFPAPGGIDAAALDQSAAELGVEVVHLRAADGTKLYGWYRSAPPAAHPACAVVYFHGNAETVLGSAPLGRYISRAGCGFLVVAMRGYPGSEGAPGEAGMALDARAAWDHLVKERAIPPERIALHGRSLGGGIAAGLAAEVQPAALILEATFTDLPSVAAAVYPWLPVRRLIRHQFPTAARAASFRFPVLVAHGDADQTIPVTHGRRLSELIPRVRYVEAAGLGHNDDLVLGDPSARAAYADVLAWISASDRGEAPSGW